VSDLLDETLEPVTHSPANDSADEDEPLEGPGEAADFDAQIHVDDLGASEGQAEDADQPEVLVRVLGVPTVDGFERLGRIETNIVTYLASHGGSVTKDQLVNAVWGGRLVSDQTLFNRIAKTRAVLGRYLPVRTKSSTTVRLDSGVGTDLAVLQRSLAEAATQSAGEAIENLSEALDLVRGVPFDSADFEWAHEQQFVADACETIEKATLRVVRLALELGEPAAAREAVTQGLRALPGNEPIYRARMEIEHALGNSDGVNNALRELTCVLAGAVDDGFACDPSPETFATHSRLTAPA
jgi:hypothetical protein